MKELDEQKRIFSKNLTDQLAAHDLLQADLVRALNTTSASVGYWCTGKQIPRMDKVQAICDFLHISKSDLLEDHSKDNIEVFGFHHALNAFKRFEKYMEYLSPDDLDEMEMLCKHKAEKNKKSKVITVYNPEDKNNE